MVPKSSAGERVAMNGIKLHIMQVLQLNEMVTHLRCCDYPSNKHHGNTEGEKGSLSMLKLALE